VFRCERRGHLWVSSSKEIVCCQLQTPCFSENKNTKKLIQNTQKCCLRHATNVRFLNFRDWRRISKSRSARFFYAPNQKKCPIIPRFWPESLNIAWQTSCNVCTFISAARISTVALWAYHRPLLHHPSFSLSLSLSLTLSLPATVSLYLVRVRARTFFLSLSRHLIFPSIHTLRVRVCTWVVCAFVRVWLFHWQRAHELSEVLRFCRRHASGPVCNCFDLSFDAKHNMFIYVHIAPRSCVVS